MKTNILITTLLAISTLAGTRTLHAQGSLTPPAGPPTVTSHTLNEIYDKAAAVEGSNADQTTKIDSIKTRVDKVDGRIPLADGSPGVYIDSGSAFVINAPGSYYLTENINITGTTKANGVSIRSANVILDLNGYSIICTSGNGNIGVSVGSDKAVHIKNGTIRGGVSLTGTTFSGTGWLIGMETGGLTHVSDLIVTGTREKGISNYIGLVEHCVADTCKGTGIAGGTVIDSIARSCGQMGIFTGGSGANIGIVKGCYGETVGSGQVSGIYAFDGTVTDSIGIAKSWYGIYASNVSHSKGVSVSAQGISAQESADNSTGISTSDIGLEALVATNCTGKSTSGFAGLSASTASFCRGTRTGGTAISANIAIGCTSGGGTITATQKHLGTP